MWQLFHPFSLRIIQPLLESIYYDLVNNLSLSIPLGISWYKVSTHNSQIAAISPEGFTIKLKAVVQDEGVRDPEPDDNVFPKKFLGIYVFDIHQGLSFNPFGKVVRADQQIPLIPYGLGERTNDI